MEIKDFISGTVTYDKFGGQYFWINGPDEGTQMLGEMRGWGHIQNMFKDKDGNFSEEGMEKAAEFQDAVGDWIASAINEKMEREKVK